MPTLRIILLCIAAAVVYGILHDQVTARVCVQYFTIGHRPPSWLTTTDPTLLGFAWGFIATWWVGAGLGIMLAIAARAGPWPPRSPGSLIRPVIVLMLVSAVCALTSGITGYYLAQAGKFDPQLAYYIAPQKRSAFIADLFAHSASYAAGFIGGVVIIAYVGWARIAHSPRSDGSDGDFGD